MNNPKSHKILKRALKYIVSITLIDFFFYFVWLGGGGGGIADIFLPFYKGYYGVILIFLLPDIILSALICLFCKGAIISKALDFIIITAASFIVCLITVTLILSFII